MKQIKYQVFQKSLKKVINHVHSIHMCQWDGFGILPQTACGLEKQGKNIIYKYLRYELKKALEVNI